MNRESSSDFPAPPMRHGGFASGLTALLVAFPSFSVLLVVGIGTDIAKPHAVNYPWTTRIAVRDTPFVEIEEFETPLRIRLGGIDHQLTWAQLEKKYHLDPRVTEASFDCSNSLRRGASRTKSRPENWRSRPIGDDALIVMSQDACAAPRDR